MKRLWVFLVLAIIVSIASIPETAWAQTSLAETYKVQRFGPDSVINILDDEANVKGIVTIRTGPSDWYVFFATWGLSIRSGYVWRYDSRNKEWRQFGPANGLNLSLTIAWTIIVGSNNRLLVSGDGGIWTSDNFGETWRFVEFPYDHGYQRISAFAKTSDGAIYAGGYGLFRSADNGEIWAQLLSKDTTYPYVKSIAIMPSGAILVGYGADNGTSKGGILKSTDRGQSWFHADAGLDSLKNVQGLVAVGGFSKMVFVMTSNGGIYRSEYEGEGWRKLNSYPVSRFGDLLGLGITPLGLFAGYDDGYGRRKLFRSIDYGEHWTELTGFNDNLPMCFGYSVVRPNELIMGTDDFGYLFIFDNPLKVEDKGIPATFSLSQNFPNPFNPTTTIEFTLPERSFVKLVVFNTLGQEVAVLVNEEKGAGTHQIVWNAAQYPTGVYLYRLETKNFVSSRKMLLMK